MKIERKDVWYLIGYMLIISIFVSVIIGGFLFEHKTDSTKIYLEDLGQEGIDYQICNGYINTWMFVCRENNTFWDEVLYNHTQNELDNLIIECPTGTIEKWTYCVGDPLTINNKEFIEKEYFESLTNKNSQFADIVVEGAENSGFKNGTFNATNNGGSLDTTSLSGLQYAYFDITIGCNTTGTYLESPVLQMHYTEGKELPPGAIVELTITKRTGSDYGFGRINYHRYIDTEYPIKLGGDLYWNADEQKYYMTAVHSGVYRIEIDWDANYAKVGGQLLICVDDLGDYRAKDITGSTQANAECFTINMV